MVGDKVVRDKYLFEPDPDNQVPPSHRWDRDEIARLFGVNKTARKQRSNQAQQGLQQRLALNPPDAHQDLHEYERDHLTGGGNWAQMKATLLLRYRGVLATEWRPFC